MSIHRNSERFHDGRGANMTHVHRTDHTTTTDVDISSAVFWGQSFEERDETFAWLRRHAPVSWQPPIEDPSVPPEQHQERGYWALTTNEDVRLASLNHGTFSSASGVSLRPRPPDAPSQPPSFLEMDPPNQTRYRQIISAAFTPKAIAKINAKIEERARAIVANVVGAGAVDFVESVSAKLPMVIVADMVGVPEDLVETFARAGDAIVNAQDEAYLPVGVSSLDYVMQQVAILHEIGIDLVKFRRKHPVDDVAGAIAAAQIDGGSLSDDVIGSLMTLLSVAGNDTTKQTTTLSVLQLDRNPDQKEWLLEDFGGRIARAIDEFVRHATPVISFARTAARDCEIGGQQVAAGDKVALFYCSANRDEKVFDEPHRFNLSRSPNPHVGFGGGGVHFCLGNGVAKAELRALFREIFAQLPDLRVTGQPEFVQSDMFHVVKHLPVHTH
jgi:cytochrome P450